MVGRRIERVHIQGNDNQHDASKCLLLTAADAAALCCKSLRTWRSWDAAGRIPRAVRIGRSVLWRAEELRAWTVAGCPCRKDWEAQQELGVTQ
jgi:predicted DNA-binding transcriptional regulator AlpA